MSSIPPLNYMTTQPGGDNPIPFLAAAGAFLCRYCYDSGIACGYCGEGTDSLDCLFNEAKALDR